MGDAVVHYAPRTLHFACRVLAATPSALDAANLEQLQQLRRAVLPAASMHAIAAAAAAGIGT